MTDLETPPLNDADWEVPSHEVACYASKLHKYALVIPVINEGTRIRGQLSRIKDAGLPVDVIVADGGSTDGSLDAEFVEPIGVRAVLTKTGPGKLSAQLRMAYAWCLREGYAGIVTIDGNGKDGVEAVLDMVAKLEEGGDYVQGSRYLPGGEAENTPLERTIANRLIHAPMLSIAGRHVFTDTTNGFRAYSARYLTHPKVRPFRAEFEVYNLLFYLTVRAGQLGLKVVHVPVKRRYPDSGNVPTKIGGFGSKLALLGETVKAATGGYTPDSASSEPRLLLWPAIAAALVLIALLLSVVVEPNYSPDSWALYELSKTVFSDFYRFTHYRSYSSTSEYSSAFAPLWPVVIAVVDAVLGTGARTGLYLAFASFFAFALVAEQIGRQLLGARWIGLSLALLLLLGPRLVLDEMEGGRTIPLQLLLYAVILQGLLRGKAISVKRAGIIGIIAGLAIMNRFDALFLPAFVTGMVLWLTRSPLRAGVALFGSLAAISPWIGYSLQTFGTVFATDNSGVALTLDPRAFVTDWWPQPQPSLSDDPSAWAIKVFGNAGQWIINGLALLFTPLGFAFASGAVVIGGFQKLCAKAPKYRVEGQNPLQRLRVLVVFALSLSVLMLPQILTGYLQYRYYCALIWAALLVVAAWQILRGETMRQRQVFASIFAGILGLWLIGFCVLQLGSAANSGRLGQEQFTRFEAAQDVEALKRCIDENQNARILVMGDNPFVAKAGALGSLRTMMMPRNMAEGRLDAAGQSAFVDTWQVEYIVVRDETVARSSLSGFSPVPDCSLQVFKRSL